MAEAYRYLYEGALIVLGLMLFPCLYRAARGPEIADRIIAVNMTGTVTIIIICLLALMTEEGYLVDIALIYAMLSFLAVVLLCKIYIGIHLAGKGRDKNA